MNVYDLLRIIHSQGYAETITFKLHQAADLIGISYNEMVELSESGKVYTKRFGSGPIQWRITVRALLEYLDRESGGGS
jgi:phage host-nuclease inhibitor protein Gam